MHLPNFYLDINNVIFSFFAIIFNFEVQNYIKSVRITNKNPKIFGGLRILQ